MPLTATDVVNAALQMIGDNAPTVEGAAPTFDDSDAGKAAQALYTPTVETVARLFEWDMARTTATLVLSGNTAPWPWAYEYIYPVGGIEIWQLLPATLADPNNPLPINWDVANAVVAGQQRRVIQTDLADAKAVYNNNPRPEAWDSLFTEAVTRLLASKFAMAVAGRPETSENLLQSFNAFVQAAKGRDG